MAHSCYSTQLRISVVTFCSLPGQNLLAIFLWQKFPNLDRLS
jgi:hypothetical protein